MNNSFKNQQTIEEQNSRRGPGGVPRARLLQRGRFLSLFCSLLDPHPYSEMGDSTSLFGDGGFYILIQRLGESTYLSRVGIVSQSQLLYQGRCRGTVVNIKIMMHTELFKFLISFLLLHASHTIHVDTSTGMIGDSLVLEGTPPTQPFFFT